MRGGSTDYRLQITEYRLQITENRLQRINIIIDTKCSE